MIYSCSPDAPFLDIHCWLRGSTCDDRFDISIMSNASIGTLKQLIKEKESDLRDVKESHMRLYRISESEDELRESLDTIDAGHLLDVTKIRSLSDYFLGVPVLENIWVIVQVYSEANCE